MSIEIEHPESGRRLAVSPAVARAMVARGWTRAADVEAPAVDVTPPAEPEPEVEPELETYERVTPRFDTTSFSFDDSSDDDES